MEKAYKLEFPAAVEGIMYTTSCGLSKTEPLHSFGPAVKPFYLIHYVLQGKGRFISGEKEYRLTKGYGFLITPDKLAFYEADKEDPWTYVWVGFSGIEIEESIKKMGFSEAHPIFYSDKSDKIYEIIQDMLEHNTSSFSDKLRRNGDLGLFLSLLCGEDLKEAWEKEDKGNVYVQRAVDFVRMNYCNPIKVKDIADYVSINRSYLYSLFEKYLHISPQEFLTLYRLTKSLELLHSTDYTIESIALSTGYTDVYVYTKAFKREKNMSPSAYRNKMRLGGEDSSKNKLKELEEFIERSLADYR